jgi:hypothetical protein
MIYLFFVSAPVLVLLVPSTSTTSTRGYCMSPRYFTHYTTSSTIAMALIEFNLAAFFSQNNHAN